MSVASETFLAALEKSHLLSAEQLSAVRCEAAEEADAKAVAIRLIKRGLITRWQAEQLLVGRTALVLGKYKLLERIGKGGMGAVYKAEHVVMGRTVALKVMAQTLVNDPTAEARFRREVQAAAKLNHVNIVRAHDADCAGKTHFLVMEYVEGHDLKHWLDQHGMFSIPWACECIRQAALGLQHAHAHGMVHRDIKPSNLLLTSENPGGRPLVKILDMGLARFVSTATEDGGLTQSGQLMGTPDYIAPEQIQDTKRADIRADVFSLGCTLFHLLTGEVPFRGDTIVTKLMARMQSDAPPITSMRADVPRELEAVIARMLALDPMHRQGTPAEVAAELAPFAEGAALGTAETIDQSAAALTATLAPTVCRSEDDTGMNRFADHLAVVPPADSRHALGSLQIRADSSKQSQKPGVGKGWVVWTKMPRAAILVAVAVVVLLAAMIPFVLPRQVPLATAKIAVKQELPAAAAPIEELVKTSSPPTSPLPSPHAPGETQTSNGEATEPAGSVVDNPALSSNAESKTEPAGSTTSEKSEPVEPERVPAPDPPSPSNPEPADNTVVREEMKEGLAQQLRSKELDAKFALAVRPVEELVEKWDFLGAVAAAEPLGFEEQDLAQRLEERREQVASMARLKKRMIEKINAARPRLDATSDLVIRGVVGEAITADQDGISISRRGEAGKNVAWSTLSGKSLKRFVPMVIDNESGDEWRDAALLALVAKDATLARTYLGEAQSRGVNVDSCLAPLANELLAQVDQLLEQREIQAADRILNELEQSFGGSPWFAANRSTFAASREKMRSAILEAEADKLYVQASELFKKNHLFDLRPIVERLKADYPSSLAVSDSERRPSFVEMEQAVAGLGRFITVRLDGKGDFQSIQEAIDDAPPKSLIEIQDFGPYNEKLVIPEDRRELTLRGKEGCFPIITSVGPRTNFAQLMRVEAPGTTLERLVLSHGAPAGTSPTTLEILKAGRVRHCVLWFQAANSMGPTALSCHATEIDTCVVAGLVYLRDESNMGNCICFDNLSTSNRNELFNTVLSGDATLGPDSQLRRCTLVSNGLARVSEARISILDSIVSSIECTVPGTRIEHCNVYGNTPFMDLAKPGKGCFAGNPRFVNSDGFDYRLMPASPCRGRASDGGDVGVRYTPEMVEMLKIALELRARRIIEF
jgi:serine/threonine protein kinase